MLREKGTGPEKTNTYSILFNESLSFYFLITLLFSIRSLGFLSRPTHRGSVENPLSGISQTLLLSDFRKDKKALAAAIRIGIVSQRVYSTPTRV